MCGLRIAATGVAACVVEVEGDDGPVFFGSPITNNVFTEYATIDQCEPFPLGTAKRFFPHPLYSRVCILHHEGVAGMGSYELTDLTLLRHGPDDYMDVLE